MFNAFINILMAMSKITKLEFGISFDDFD